MKITCTGASIKVTEPEVIAAGSVNIYKAEFTFDEAWAGLTKVAFFVSRDQLYPAVLDEENKCTIPWEAIKYDGWLQIACGGFQGTSKVLTSLYTKPQRIGEGADYENFTPPPSALAEVLMYMAASAQSAAQAAQSAADAQHQPIVGDNGNWYTWNPDTQAYADTGVRAQGPQGEKGDTGNGIASVVRTSGTGAPGTTDTYTITFTDGDTAEFTVTHGTDGVATSQLTGYSKALTSEQLLATDTVLQAFGKLEKRIDDNTQQISQIADQDLESLYSQQAPQRSPKHLATVTGSNIINMPNNVAPDGEMFSTISGVTGDVGGALRHTLGSQKLLSRGKNWLDMSKLANGPWYMDGDVLVKRAGIYADSNIVYLDLPKGINFIFSYRNILGGIVRYKTYIVDKVTLETISSLSFNSPFTLNEGQLFSFTFDPSSSQTFEVRMTLQLEMGTVATEHVPYIESKQFIRTPYGAPLRSVPNISDQIRRNKNEYEIVRHVGVDSNISGSKYASIDTSTYINVDVVKTTAFADAVNRVATVDVIGNIRYYNKNGVELTEVAQADIDLTTSIGKCYFHTDRTLWIIVAKGAYADIASARADLGTTSLLYRLYTPIITDCEVSGNITPYPNGSIEFSPCLWGFTSEASTIIGSVDAPIGDIAKVEKLKRNERTGQLEVEVDVTANCSHDGTTLTIGSFTPGLYRYDCTVADGYSTEPSVTVAVEDIGGIETHDYAAGATAWVLTDNENKADYFVALNAGGATAMVMQPQNGVPKTIENISGQSITVKTATSTGVTVGTGKIATVIYNGAEFKKISEV